MRRDAQRNQELVLDAARQVISELGTDAPMDLVAARAGVGIGTVYRRFPNKEALIDELVRIILDELITVARQALERADGSGLELFFRACGRTFSEHRGYVDKLVGHVPPDCAAILNDLMIELLEQAKQHGAISSQITSTDVRATLWAIRGVIETAGPLAPQAWERHLDLHLAGLRCGPTQESG